MKIFITYFFCFVGLFQASGQNCPEVLELSRLNDSTYLSEVSHCTNVKVQLIFKNYLDQITFEDGNAYVIQALNPDGSDELYYLGLTGKNIPKGLKDGDQITISGQIEIKRLQVAGFTTITYLFNVSSFHLSK